MSSTDQTFALHGPRVLLRLPQTSDATALYRIGRDPEATRWFTWGPYVETADALEYVESLPGHLERGTRFDLLQVDADLGPVGVTGLSDFGFRDRRALVGSWLMPGVWGTGVNNESKALVAHLAFELLGLRRLGALVDPRNGRSRTALERAGFQEEGTLRSWTVLDGEPTDMVSYALLADEWRERPELQCPVRIEGEVPAAFTTLLRATEPGPGGRR